MEGVMDGRIARPGIYVIGREVLGMGFPYLERVWGGGIGSKRGRRRDDDIESKGERDEEDTVLLF